MIQSWLDWFRSRRALQEELAALRTKLAAQEEINSAYLETINCLKSGAAAGAEAARMVFRVANVLATPPSQK
jgi:hypothetical protein